jgi:hypothetical protein
MSARATPPAHSSMNRCARGNWSGTRRPSSVSRVTKCAALRLACAEDRGLRSLVSVPRPRPVHRRRSRRAGRGARRLAPLCRGREPGRRHRACARARRLGRARAPRGTCRLAQHRCHARRRRDRPLAAKAMRSWRLANLSRSLRERVGRRVASGRCSTSRLLCDRHAGARIPCSSTSR